MGNSEQVFLTSLQTPVAKPKQTQRSGHFCQALPPKALDHPLQRLHVSIHELDATEIITNAKKNIITVFMFVNLKNLNLKVFKKFSQLSSNLYPHFGAMKNIQFYVISSNQINPKKLFLASTFFNNNSNMNFEQNSLFFTFAVNPLLR